MIKCRLGDIYKFQYGKGNNIPENKGEYPCYGSNGQVGYHTEYNSEDAPIIGHIGAYAGVVIWAPGKHFVTYNGVICTLKDREKINPRYGFYLLKSQDFVNKVRRGVAQPFVSYDLLEEPIVNIPSRLDQDKIVRILDLLTTMIENQSEQIKILNELVESQFVEMFENENRYVNLEDVCIFINGDRGKNYPSADKISKDSNGVPFINAGLLTNNGVDWENMNYISEETYNKLGSGKIQKDDILYCLRGSLGKHAIIDFDNKGAIASSLVILRADQSKIQPNFLLIQLGMDEIVRQQIQANNGSSQPNLSAGSVKKYKIKLPDTESQSEFVNIVNQIDKQKFEIQKSLDEMNCLYESLMNNYFGE